MPPDPTDREARAATPQFDIAALRASPCGMAHERIRTGLDGLPSRDATLGGYSRPDLCPAAVRNGNLGCSHTAARLALIRAFDGLEDGLGDGLEGDGIEALREELRSLDAALGIIDHRRHRAENRRADALWARDVGAAALAEDEIRAITAEHRAGGLRAGEIRDLLAARLAGRPAGRPRREGEVQAASPALAEPRSRLYAGR